MSSQNTAANVLYDKDFVSTIETVLDSASVGIAFYDHDLHYTYINSALAEINGVSVEDTLGKTPRQVVPEFGGEIERQLRDVLHAHRPVKQEITGKTPALGTPHYWLVNYYPIISEGTLVGAAAIVTDITQRKLAEESVLLNESRLKTLLKLNEMTDAPLKAITDFALEEAVRLTSSTIGYLAFVSEDEKVLTMHSWSGGALKECNVQDKALIYYMDKIGLWGEVVRQRKPVITNDYDAPSPLKKGYPAGHIPIKRHMNIPVFDGPKVVAVAGVGNKELPYDESDVRQLQLLMSGMYRLVQRQQAQQRLRESEEMMRFIVKHDPNAIGVFNNQMRYIAVSKRFLKDYNVKESDVLGKSHYEVFPEMPQRWKDIHKRVLAGAVERSEEDHFTRPDGSITYNRWECRPWHHADGTIGGLIMYTEVTTERKLAEIRLREKSDELERMFQLSLDLLAVADMDGRFLKLNPEWEKTLGYSLEELENHNFLDFVHPDDLDSTIQSIARLAAGEIIIDFTNRYRCKDGSYRWIEWRSIPYQDRLIYAAARDITSRKLAHEAQAKLTRQLQMKNDELETILYVASHDLRSALVNIQGFSRELSESFETVLSDCGQLPPESKALSSLKEDIPVALSFVTNSVGKIDSILNGLLRLSRLGRQALKIEHLDMKRLMNHIAQSMEYKIRTSGATLRINRLPSCRGDASLLDQAFSNLIDNAIKYRDPSRQLVINITGKIENGKCVYCVEDNGLGIENQFFGKIFEVFHRLEPGKTSGEGLGLSIVHRIIDLHNGQVWVESKPKLGSRFFISLPC